MAKHSDFIVKVGEQALRKLKAKQRVKESIWSGLGMFGLVGWSIVVPTLLGVALGMWLDRRFPSRYSWTLTLLVCGLILGCLNAWHWISSEDKNMRAEDSPGESSENGS